MKRAEKRDHLVAIAAALFNKAGFHGTGIDQIVEAAGIAKTTLYRHFNSKEELIVAALRRIDHRYREDMRRAVDQASADGADRLLATFDFLEEWFEAKTFHGCPFVNAAAEYGDRSNAIFQEAQMHKRLVVAYLEELARAAGIGEPTRIAEWVNLLHEGATSIAHVTGRAQAASEARSIAATLIACDTRADHTQSLP